MRENDSYPKGEGHGMSKFKVDDIKEIRKMISDGMTDKEIADHYDVSRNAIRLIKIGKNWRSVA